MLENYNNQGTSLLKQINSILIALFFYLFTIQGKISNFLMHKPKRKEGIYI